MNIYSSLILPNFGYLQVFAPHWNTRYITGSVAPTSHADRPKTTLNNRKRKFKCISGQLKGNKPSFNGFSLAYLQRINASVFEFRSMILRKKGRSLLPKHWIPEGAIKFRYLSCLFSAIIILTSKFFLGKTVNISENRRHIYLFGQPLTKFNNSTCEVKGRSVSVRILNFIAIRVVKFRIPPS